MYEIRKWSPFPREGGSPDRSFTMKTYLKIPPVVLVFFICCAFFIGSCSSRPGKGGPDGRPGPGGPDWPGKNFISTVFDTKPFNMSVDKLGPMYTGHDPELLYNNIRLRKESGAKDAHETDEQYRERIGREISRHLMGTLDFDSTYAFRITPKEVLYNVKDQVMQVRCPLSFVFEGGRREGTKKAFTVKYRPQLDNRYTITDSRGSRIEVEEIKFLEHAVVLTNAGDFPIERVALPDTGGDTKTKNAGGGVKDEKSNREAITGTIKMAPEDAKRFEGGIMALLVCKLAAPYTSYEEIRRGPTAEKPGVYLASYHYLHIRLLEIWFYDVMSGKVFKKMGMER